MRKISKVALAWVIAVSIVGCGGGGGGGSAAVGANPPPTTAPPSGSLGSATISWTAPTENTDGSPLTDLNGFVIRYGQDANNLDSFIDIDGVGSMVRMIENLTAGTWYFSVAARNRQGVVSAPSATVSKVIG